MNQYYIGMMSGTSMDGIDAVIIDFSNDDSLKVVFHHYLPYPATLRAEISRLCQPGASITSMLQLDAELGELYAQVIDNLLVRSGLCSKEIIAIGNHGQTIAHMPDSKYPSTLQLGDGNRIAQHTGITTITDFRRRDMAAGGQGAPLVPAFHEYLFRTETMDRIVLNLGGIANVTLLPADRNKNVSGFDTGPGNTLLDHWCQRFTSNHIDTNGDWAKTGRLITGMLEKLLRDRYFQREAPKSTGIDYFNLSWLEQYLTDYADEKAEDIQATLLHLTTSSITDAIQRFQPSTKQLIVCGGGTHNTHLMQQLSSALSGIDVTTTQDFGYDPDYIEAMAFAWLARQTMEHKPGNLPAVTGAKQQVILGAIYQV